MQDKGILEVGLQAFSRLLDEFRSGNIANEKSTRQSLERHMAELSTRWDEQFPGFPKSWFPYLSSIGLSGKEAKTAHLKEIIIQRLKTEGQNHGERVIVNPACFLGRRARHLA